MAGPLPKETGIHSLTPESSRTPEQDTPMEVQVPTPLEITQQDESPDKVSDLASDGGKPPELNDKTNIEIPLKDVEASDKDTEAANQEETEFIHQVLGSDDES